MNSGGGVKPIRMSTDMCLNYEVGRKVFDYLEDRLTDDGDIEEFVTHAADCGFCMKTMVRYQYDIVVTERENARNEIRHAQTDHESKLDADNWRPSSIIDAFNDPIH